MVNFAVAMIRFAAILFISTPLFAQDGGAKVNVTDVSGLKQGPWIKYFPDSKVVRYRGQFRDNKPYGEFTYYYFPGGEVKTVMKYSSPERASVKSLYKDGHLMATGVYHDEAKDSTWTYYNMYGEKVSVEYYIRGKRYGNSLKFHHNGNLLEEVYFENDLENGPYREYYENGVLAKKGTYVHGSLEGEVVFYHPNGQVYYSGIYHKDVKDGIWITYNDRGEVTDKRQYIRGIPQYHDSELIFEDSLKYYRKDSLDISDFIPEEEVQDQERGRKKENKQ